MTYYLVNGTEKLEERELFYRKVLQLGISCTGLVVDDDTIYTFDEGKIIVERKPRQERGRVRLTVLPITEKGVFSFTKGDIEEKERTLVEKVTSLNFKLEKENGLQKS